MLRGTTVSSSRFSEVNKVRKNILPVSHYWESSAVVACAVIRTSGEKSLFVKGLSEALGADSLACN